MKIDKEKMLSKVNNITKETKNITSNITTKSKDWVIDAKDKVVTKIEETTTNQIITEEDIIKILDGVYQNVLNGIGKASPSVEDLHKII